jgi:CBS domain-containing protein
MTKTIADGLNAAPGRHFIDADATVQAILRQMRAENARAVAICSGTRVVGVFTVADILNRVVLQALELDQVIAKDVMSTPVHWIAAEERYEVAKAIMVAKGVQQLVVLDKQGEFCGFVTATHLLEADLSISRELVAKLNDSYYEPRFQPQA